MKSDYLLRTNCEETFFQQCQCFATYHVDDKSSSNQSGNFPLVCKVTEAKVIKIVLAEAFKVACFTNTRLLLKINMHIYYNDLYGKPIGQGGFSHLLGKLLF